MGMFEAWQAIEEWSEGMMDKILRKPITSYTVHKPTEIDKFKSGESFLYNRPQNHELTAAGIPLSGNRPLDSVPTDSDVSPSGLGLEESIATEADIFTDSVTGESDLAPTGLGQEEAVAAAEDVAEEVTSTDFRGVSEVRGVRNNNPLNIEHGDNWDGLADEQLDTRFATFSDAEHGIRAAARILNTYRESHGVETLSDIIHRWAPPNENDTEAYVKNVAEWSGLPINRQLVAGNNEATKSLLKAMARQENGRDAANEVGDDVYDRALELAFPE